MRDRPKADSICRKPQTVSPSLNPLFFHPNTSSLWGKPYCVQHRLKLPPRHCPAFFDGYAIRSRLSRLYLRVPNPGYSSRPSHLFGNILRGQLNLVPSCIWHMLFLLGTPSDATVSFPGLPFPFVSNRCQSVKIPFRRGWQPR